MSFSLKDLSDLEWKYRCSNTQMPAAYVVRTKFTDKTANGLTKAVITFLTLHGHQAERINTTGRYLDNSKIVTDCIGRQRVLGKGKWIPGTSTKGSADISAIVKGISVKLEIKMKDKQSQAQKDYQQAVENAGGKYYLVHSFEEFISYYNAL